MWESMFDEQKVLCGIIVLVKVKGAENKVDDDDHINDDQDSHDDDNDDDDYHYYYYQCESERVSG